MLEHELGGYNTFLQKKKNFYELVFMEVSFNLVQKYKYIAGYEHNKSNLMIISELLFL